MGRVPEALRVTIRKSKTDPEGEGAVIAIPEGTRLHPAARLDAWIARAGLSDGFLFRHLSVTDAVTPSPMSDRAVARLVQACAKAAGFGPAAFAGHSLRNRRAACMPRFAIGGEIIPYHPGSTAGQRSGARVVGQFKLTHYRCAPKMAHGRGRRTDRTRGRCCASACAGSAICASRVLSSGAPMIFLQMWTSRHAEPYGARRGGAGGFFIATKPERLFGY